MLIQITQLWQLHVSVSQVQYVNLQHASDTVVSSLDSLQQSIPKT